MKGTLIRLVAVLLLVSMGGAHAAEVAQPRLRLVLDTALAYAQQYRNQDFRKSPDRGHLQSIFVEDVARLKSRGEVITLLDGLFEQYQTRPQDRAAIEELVPLIYRARFEDIKDRDEYSYLMNFTDKFILLMIIPAAISIRKSMRQLNLQLREKVLNAQLAKVKATLRELGKPSSDGRAKKMEKKLLKLQSERMESEIKAKSGGLCKALFIGAAALGAGAWAWLDHKLGDHESYHPEEWFHRGIMGLVTEWNARAKALENNVEGVIAGEIDLREEEWMKWRSEANALANEVQSFFKREEDMPEADLRVIRALKPLELEFRMFLMQGVFGEDGMRILRAKAEGVIPSSE